MSPYDNSRNCTAIANIAKSMSATKYVHIGHLVGHRELTLCAPRNVRDDFRGSIQGLGRSSFSSRIRPQTASITPKSMISCE
jgi:hypothetical protein